MKSKALIILLSCFPLGARGNVWEWFGKRARTSPLMTWEDQYEVTEEMIPEGGHFRIRGPFGIEKPEFAGIVLTEEKRVRSSLIFLSARQLAQWRARNSLLDVWGVEEEKVIAKILAEGILTRPEIDKILEGERFITRPGGLTREDHIHQVRERKVLTEPELQLMLQNPFRNRLFGEKNRYNYLTIIKDTPPCQKTEHTTRVFSMDITEIGTRRTKYQGYYCVQKKQMQTAQVYSYLIPRLPLTYDVNETWVLEATIPTHPKIPNADIFVYSNGDDYLVTYDGPVYNLCGGFCEPQGYTFILKQDGSVGSFLASSLQSQSGHIRDLSLLLADLANDKVYLKTIYDIPEEKAFVAKMSMDTTPYFGVSGLTYMVHLSLVRENLLPKLTDKEWPLYKETPLLFRENWSRRDGEQAALYNDQK